MTEAPAANLTPSINQPVYIPAQTERETVEVEDNYFQAEQ